MVLLGTSVIATINILFPPPFPGGSHDPSLGALGAEGSIPAGGTWEIGVSISPHSYQAEAIGATPAKRVLHVNALLLCSGVMDR